MSGNDALRDLLTDSFTRVHELVGELTDACSDDVLRYRPDPQANTVAWLLWHLSRVQDDHVADLAGMQQVWPAWRERFALPFEQDATGYGQRPEEVAQVRVDADLLAGYHADVHALSLRYVRALDTDELARVVDESWDPPVTASARLVSVLGDCLQHLGQASYVAGLAQRAGLGR
ncbi:mycothiol transferase [Microlunatus lacustris]